MLQQIRSLAHQTSYCCVSGKTTQKHGGKVKAYLLRNKMTLIESSIIVKKPVHLLYQFLCNFNNHAKLMPPSIQHWTSNDDEASFTIQNIAILSLKISKRVENETIVAIPSTQTATNIQLQWQLNPIDKLHTQALLTLSAQLPPLMKLIARTPLQKIADYNTLQLITLFQ